MHRNHAVAAAMAVVLLVSTARATPITYSYSGIQFTAFIDEISANGSNTYDGTMRIAGVLTVDDSFLNGATLTDVAAGITGYSFSDGVNTLTETNSEITMAKLAVDGSNHILDWNVHLFRPASPLQVGEEYWDIYTSNGVAAKDFGVTGSITDVSGSRPLYETDRGDTGFFPVGENPGTWSIVPEPSTLALAGIGLLALAVSLACRGGLLARCAWFAVVLPAVATLGTAAAEEVIFTIDAAQSTQKWNGSHITLSNYVPQSPGRLEAPVTGHFLASFDPFSGTPTQLQLLGGVADLAVQELNGKSQVKGDRS